jgi:hypothetical protein
MASLENPDAAAGIKGARRCLAVTVFALALGAGSRWGQDRETRPIWTLLVPDGGADAVDVDQRLHRVLWRGAEC